MTPILLGEWNTVDDARRDLREQRWDDDGLVYGELPDIGFVILAAYYAESYEGDAYILTRLDGRLVDCEMSHCSCSGLEGMWSPRPTTAEAIKAAQARARAATQEEWDEKCYHSAMQRALREAPDLEL